MRKLSVLLIFLVINVAHSVTQTLYVSFAQGSSSDLSTVVTAYGNVNFASATAPTFTETFGTSNKANFTSTGYVRINASDNTYAILNSSGTNYEPFAIFNFTIPYSLSSINWIFISMEQSEATAGSTGTGEYCYYAVANWSSSSWYKFGSYVNGQTDTTRTYNITNSLKQQFVNSNNVLSMLSWGANMDAGEGCRVDHVYIIVDYTPSAGNSYVITSSDKFNITMSTLKFTFLRRFDFNIVNLSKKNVVKTSFLKSIQNSFSLLQTTFKSQSFFKSIQDSLSLFQFPIKLQNIVKLCSLNVSVIEQINSLLENFVGGEFIVKVTEILTIIQIDFKNPITNIIIETTNAFSYFILLIFIFIMDKFAIKT